MQQLYSPTAGSATAHTALVSSTRTASVAPPGTTAATRGVAVQVELESSKFWNTGISHFRFEG
jgi:hypothetical protein